ncbi:MAG: amidohydrolase [Myxococcaceae bacterium]|nr:amidohydrolase [Myxococcaceae bacterium]MCI0668855.1 amidohydrolase [Myxococcaceae bacterium]
MRLFHAGEDMSADTTVYLPERIRTLDPEHPLAEALAVRNGKLLAVGTRHEVLSAAGHNAKRIELPGATLVPGLQDAHGHLAGLGGSLVTVDLSEATSESDAVARLKQVPATSSQGDWLTGRGWDQNDWPGKAFPTARLLDEAFPSTPVVLTRIDHHAVWVNTAALERAHITAKTQDPPGGRILRDAKGNPTGVLVDNAMALVQAALPPLTDEQLATRLQAAFTRCAAAGLTVVHDAGMDLRTFRMLQGWDMLGRLPLRVYAMATGTGPDAERYLELGTTQGRRLTMRAVKLFMDGALGSRGAALHEPYSDAPGETGLLLLSPEELEQRARVFMEAGFQVSVHAIGDRANTLVIDTLARTQEATQTKHLRHRVEHAQILRSEDIAKLAEAGLVASFQPTHATSDMPWAEERLGKERLKGAYAWQSVRKAGAVVALGSDFPIERPEVLPGLYAARTRQDAKGRPEGGWYPEERLTGEEALSGFTTGAAYASHSEDRRGMLKPGMDADFVALSKDPVEAPPRELLEAKVLLTVVAGDILYAHEDTLSALSD